MLTDTAIDAAIDAALAERRIVGGVVLVARDGAIVYRRAAGLADREQACPMREDSVFRLASLSKPIVTAAAMAMVERGRLGLDRPVTDWLPDFRPALPDGAVPAITIRHLLKHTSGLTYGFLQPEGGSYSRHGVSDGLDQPGLSMAEEMRRLAGAPLTFPPGQTWNYSLAIDVLGAAMETIENARLDTVLRRYLTGPLKLDEIGYGLQPGQRERLATQYADGSPEPQRMNDEGHHISFADVPGPFHGLAGVHFVPNRVDDDASFQSGGGGLNGTAGDFMAFLEAMRTGGAPVLSQATVDAMMTNQTGDFAITNRGPGWGFGFGAAVLLDPALGKTPQSAGTWGWGGVWGHNWFIDRAKRLSVVILTNTALEGMMGRLTRDVRDAVYRDFGG